jgi:tetratricopeptide (TPR) repeat protein
MIKDKTISKYTTSKWLGLTLFFIGSSIFLSAENVSSYNYKPNPEQLSDYQKKKANLVEKVYNDISRTVQDMRKPPAFNFVYNYRTRPYYNAYYSPSNNTINFGEGVYDLAAKFGKDSINILAAVIGHELAHYYKDHGWAHAFGKANPDTDIKTQIKQTDYDGESRANMEAEADYFGGIFGYLAGYNTLSSSPAFFDTLYKVLELPEEVKGYPSLSDRRAIYMNSQEMLEKLIPVFQTANLLNLVGSYDKAGMCYDHIIHTFPSREMYNNAGVAFAQKAISLFAPEELKFVYPVGLDMNTRLDNAGTKGTGLSKEARRKKLLQKATQHFEDAIRMDENYTPALINIALVQTLLDEHEMALGYTSKAIKQATAKKDKLAVANAQIARGIAFANKGEKAEAKKAFKLAEEGNDLIAKTNLEVLNTNIFSKLFKKQAVDEIIGEEEAIEDIGLEALEALFEDSENYAATIIRKQSDDRPATVLISIEEEEFNAFLVSTVGRTAGLEGFIATKPDYEGSTARDIEIGSTTKEVYAAYGTPTKIMGGAQGNYLYYAKTGILFTTTSDNKVSGWMLYGLL